jgi:spore maturation protein CgeB
MNIHFFGSSLVSSYWNGAATYYRGLLKALARLGHDITFYEPDAFERQGHRDMADPDWARITVYQATPHGWEQALSIARRDADLLVKASGVGVFDAELDAAIPDAAHNGALAIYWDVDAPATLDAIESDPHHHLRRLIPRYDAILTYGGHARVLETYRRFGARACVPVYNGLDPETHYPVAAKDAFRCDLNFLGNRLPDRESRVEEFFLRPAARFPQRRFVIGGSGWEGKAMPRSVITLGHVGTGEHNAFYCSALATLNINRESMARYGFSPPTRIFEAAGAGACVVSDAWEGIDLFLQPDEEILIAKDGESVGDLLEGLSEERARAIGRRARLRLLDQHTYAHRAIEVTRFLDLAASNRVAAA